MRVIASELRLAKRRKAQAAVRRVRAKRCRATFRSAANTCRADPLRTRQASSPIVTSRRRWMNLDEPDNQHWSVASNTLVTVAQTGVFRVYLYEDKPEPSLQLRWDHVDLSSSKPILESVAFLAPWSDDELLEALGTASETPETLWDVYG
jgi:hypothetical protein